MASEVGDSSAHETEHEVSNDREAAQRAAELATKETKVLSYLRWIALFVFTSFAASVSVIAYKYSRDNEEERFKSGFFDHSSKVIDAFRVDASRRLKAIDTLSIAYTSHAIETEEVWPNVTLPDYELKASSVMDLADVIAIFQFPLVTAETRKGYETYAIESQGWLEEGVQRRQQEIVERMSQGDESLQDEQADLEFLENFLADGDAAFSIPSEIYQPIGTETGPEDGPGPYFPVWQWSPALPLPNLVNFNAIKGPSHTKELEAILESERVVTSPAFDFSDESDPNVFGRKPLINLILNRWKGGGRAYEDGPVSDLYYPIYDSFDDASRKLVAVFDTLIYWQVYFVNILPENAVGVVVVLENTCNQTFTYEINGAEATYIGPGDLHDSSFSDDGVSTGFGAFLGSDNPGVVNDSRHCSYNIRVYPSEAYKKSFVTSSPLISTLVLFCAFVFSFLVFALYDFIVERRQKVVMQTAVISTEVVAQLFPAEVRTGVYGQQGISPNDDTGDDEIKDMRTFTESPKVAKPNAALYPECTVLFADIAGFTKWSGGKNPSEVFQLLEMLYGRFDAIALKRKVFKVETIGDCYMTVTGVPQPQPDHAIRMARFARDCLLSMSEMHVQLVAKLGTDAGELALRVGLHSGSVTGGVLRGLKARFQLFGDTVNVASRMESTGEPGKIQVSEDTAALIQSTGVDEWLVEARDGLVEVKGKGKVRTYWVRASAKSSISATTTALSVASSDQLFELQTEL